MTAAVPKKNVAEGLVAILEAVGIDTCFGVPGGQTLPFYQAARERGFNHVLMRDERNCACAADAYARVSGRVGLCDATVGPGATNLVSGLAEAYASSIPMIALIADMQSSKEHLRHRGIVAQALEQRPLLEPVCKWVGRVQTPEMLADIVEHALRIATTGRCGPVVIEVPEEVMPAEIASLDLQRFTPHSAIWPRHRPAAPAASIAQAVTLLSESQRPIILAGGGAMASGAYEEVAALADRFGIPVVTSLNGKGIIDESHVKAYGPIGLFGTTSGSHALLQADTVLVLGSKYTQYNTFGWALPTQGQTLIQIDSDAEELGRAIPAALEIQADVRSTLQQLIVAMEAAALNFSWQPQGEVPLQPGTDDNDPAVAPEAVVEALNNVFAENTIVVSDASLSSGWTGSRHKVRQAGRGYLAPRGCAGLGWACGAAIGAALAAPKDTRVIVMAGDGASAYWLGEIETAVRLNLPITFVVLNNAGFGWVVQCERAMGFEQKSTFVPVDFAAVGAAMGTGHARAVSLEEVEQGLQRSADQAGPFVLDVLSSDLSTPTVDFQNLAPESKAKTDAYSV